MASAAIERLRVYGPLVQNFAGRELKTRYRRSLLGWLWSLLNPISSVIVYSLVFSVFLRAVPPESGNGESNFALYLFSGLVPWALFAGMLNGSMQWLDAIAELRRKVFFPPEAAIIGSGLALAVQSGIEMIVLLGALIVIGNVSVTLILYPLVLIATAAFGLGLGFVVAVLNTRLRDMQHLIGIGLNVLFFLTPIVYPPNLIPEESHGIPVRAIINANPVGHFVAAARDVAYLLEWPSASRIAWVSFYSVVALVGGSRFFSRRSMDLSERL